ncbi:MAG: VOC family protein [Chlorobi bacterium]|nr:VOC family protein [Chlorobiota bacterium]
MEGKVKNVVISGIQQIGIGVANLQEAWKWYRQFFGVDVKIFEEKAAAKLMLHYTGGEPRNRHAALAINLQGGGGFEIWQYTDRIPVPAKFNISLGDLGIYAAKIKTRDVTTTYHNYRAKGAEIPGGLQKDPEGKYYFFIKDLYNNLFQVVCGKSMFRNEKKLTGATYGAIIGVSNIELARVLYSGILGYDVVVYDKTGVFEDFSVLPGGSEPVRRVLLRHSQSRMGIFSKIFGPSEIELVSTLERIPNRIFQGRFWGDLGFIHLCYDVNGMDTLREQCAASGLPFTVDSQKTQNDDSFDMGEAAGRFAYVEDPDGTLIEFVETHKIPVIKKLGWYINLRKRDPEKALPDWLVKALRFNRVK